MTAAEDAKESSFGPFGPVGGGCSALGIRAVCAMMPGRAAHPAGADIVDVDWAASMATAYCALRLCGEQL